MKLGYSILLQEFVKAEFVDYGDCKDFQIVCPNCHEAVFKVTRNEHNEYLAHYKASKSQVQECELRVASISKQEISIQNAMSKGQHIKMFQAVLKEALLERAASANWSVEYLEKNISAMMKRPFYRELIRFTRSKELDKNLDDMWGKHVEEYKDKSEFYKNSQLKYANDMYEYILAPNSFAIYSFGISLAVCVSMGLLVRTERADDVVFHNVIGALIVGSNSDLLKLKNKKEHFHILLATMLASRLSLKSWLVTLPYMDILKKNISV